MVQVEEVPEDLLNVERESDYETDSALSDDDALFEDGFDPASETLYDRLVALKDIVPPTARLTAAERYEQAKAWAYWGVQKAGGVAWVVSTSALLVGLPLALAIEDETRIVQQEREMQMQSQGQQQVSRAALPGGQCRRTRRNQRRGGCEGKSRSMKQG
jgi:import receptor subunit TOM22